MENTEIYQLTEIFEALFHLLKIAQITFSIQSLATAFL